MTNQSLTSRPGEFKAICNISVHHPTKGMSPDTVRDCKERGWRLAERSYINRYGGTRRREVFLEPLCVGVEFTDRQAFEQHMRETHGKRARNGENAGLVKSAKGKWRAPRAREFNVGDHETEACPRCGLIAEVDWRASTKLWWSEHLDRCVGAAAA